jgi:PAS domain-containing protein
MSAPMYDRAFVERLLASHLGLLSQSLVPASVPGPQAVDWLYHEADFALLAHDRSPEPRFVYANAFAQRLFERTWSEIVGLPSSASAEPPAQDERAQALALVAAQGFTRNYRGLRVAKSGRRFWIEGGTLWNVLDEGGVRIGQAAAFRNTSTA